MNNLIKVIFIFLCLLLLTGCVKTNDLTKELSSEETMQDMNENKNFQEEQDNFNFFGVWRIDKVALVSNMYTGTIKDGDFEENIYDPEDYIGYELEYSSQFFRIGNETYNNPEYTLSDVTVGGFNNGGKYRMPDIYGFIEEEEIKLDNMDDYKEVSEIPIQRFDIKFKDTVSYEEYNFIPVGTQCVLLNRDTMLVGVWGKVLVAYRVE